MRILLINPNVDPGSFKHKGAFTPPIGLAYLASELIKNSPSDEVRIIDAFATKICPNDILSEAKKFLPEIVGFSTFECSIRFVLESIILIRKTGLKAKIIVGGASASEMYSHFLNKRYADFAVIGEGEISFIELVKRIKDGSNNFNINGIAFIKKRKLFCSRPALIEDINAIPFPNRNLFNNRIYAMGKNKDTAIFGSRGCPNRCIFCPHKVIFGVGARLRSPKNIIEEIKNCHNVHKISDFYFLDSTFGLSKDYVIEICALIKKNRLKIRWACRTRADLISKERISTRVLQEMRSSGCHEIAVGIESGSSRILKLTGKGITLKQAKSAVIKIKKAGISPIADFIIGNYGETKESALETIAFAKSLPCNKIAFHKMRFYPGTEIYSKAVKFRKESGELFFPCTSLTEGEIDALLKKANLTIYSSPKRFFSNLFSGFWEGNIFQKFKYIKNTLLKSEGKRQNGFKNRY